MFEGAKTGRKVSKSVFKKEEDELRTLLLNRQFALRKAKIPLVVIIAGMEAAGKSEVVNKLDEWLDSSGIQVHAFWDPSDEECERPRYWRFWRTMPPKGQMAILFGGWYMQPIEQRYLDQCDDAQLERDLRRIRDFERMLVEDGMMVVKFWYHLNEETQRERLKQRARDSEHDRWKMLPTKKSHFDEHYEKFEHVAEQVVRHTDSYHSPWNVVEATDENYCQLTTGKLLLQAIEQRLNAIDENETPDTTLGDIALPDDPAARVTVLDNLDMSLALKKDDYNKQLKSLQAEMRELAWLAYHQRRSVVMAFEGVDAGGKGGAIRRCTEAIDARLYRTISIGAPTDEEHAHHYLWRFWRHIPRAGYMTIFDRSWYGRVLVERVEGFTPASRWRPAYMEINNFEEQLCEHGIIVLKFWLQITEDEQLERFQARQETPYKSHKITEEDWRNREKWDDYCMAVNDMVEHTSTEQAPWHLIAANNKRYARIQVLSTVVDTLRRELSDSGSHKHK